MPGILHSRSASKAAEQASNDMHRDSTSHPCSNALMPPPAFPASRQHLRQDSGNRSPTRAPSKISAGSDQSEDTGLSHKRTKSSRSLKAFLERDKAKSSKKKPDTNEETPIKKSKSSTSLAALLSRPKSSKGEKEFCTPGPNNKENQPPCSTVQGPPPIWAQFATQGALHASGTTKVPLNDKRDMNDETNLHTPRNYSASKQRDFQEDQQPTSSRRIGMKPRPKSECLPSTTSHISLTETLSGLRKAGRNQGQQMSFAQHLQAREGRDEHEKTCAENRNASVRPSSEQEKIDTMPSGADPVVERRKSRVMAAVAVLNGKTKDLPKEPAREPHASELDPQAIENAFESLLEARNVPQNTRDKMRSLDTNIKADFVKKDRTGSGSSTAGIILPSSRPSSGKQGQAEVNACVEVENDHDTTEATATSKHSRSRSRTFTWSKSGQSPSKKQKSERPPSHHRKKSGELKKSTSSKSLSDMASNPLFSKKNTLATPDDFIGYLQKSQEPQEVEVGKIHKLCQLLRNETVGWVNKFIAEGGMNELVQLLYRIIGVEWREEHEDSLLHETLLCLKALSTTSLALEKLSTIQNTLFPTLLGMLFDLEKKGPSEFTTRTTIMTLLSTYLTSSTSDDLATRAQTLLTYLRDPLPPEENRPPTFIATIYHPRPYKLWTKEISNVTKEVFWVFLHHTNIIPLPKDDPTHPQTTTDYTTRHFPRPHPPVPAAPYIGGVEWDATWYLTAHLDLLNGILASLPTLASRNILRQELKDSGLEKILGGSLRTCKEKLYGSVHAALATWVAAAREDGWDVRDVRQGPPREEVGGGSPVKRCKAKGGDEAPRIEMPRLELGGGKGGEEAGGGWL